MIRLALTFASTGALIFAVPAVAQDHSIHEMPPAEPAEARPAPVAADPECSPDHAAMGHCTPKAMPDCPTGAVGTDLPAGDAPAPAAPGDWYADRLYPQAEMDPIGRATGRERVERYV